MILGLIGKKRSGKDSLAKRLVEKHDFERVAFADPLKKSVLKMNPIVFWPSHYGDLDPGPYVPKRLADVVRKHGWEAAKEERLIREYLQNYGVAIREMDEDFWVRAGMAQIDDPCCRDYVITDVRFPNEVAAVKARGGKIVRIVRPGLESTDTHISETALDDYVPDAIVLNDRDLDNLAKCADSIVESL